MRLPGGMEVPRALRFRFALGIVPPQDDDQFAILDASAERLTPSHPMTRIRDPQPKICGTPRAPQHSLKVFRCDLVRARDILSSDMNLVLLVGKEWKARALLRSQLIEEGMEVEAHESVRSALESLEAGPAMPSLLVADLAESDDPSADTEQLARWTARVPIWVIAGLNLITSKILRGREFELILTRPVDVGELVAQIKQRVGTDSP